MLAAEPPAIVQPNAADEQSGMIEIVGLRPDQAQKIDRRTYRVKQNPHSAQADTIQLLRGLPAVTITPDDQITLLGAANVRVLVDERTIHGDVTQYLRTLHGSDIERIEVITNPSAQYSPEGTGGIINIVLRKKQSNGVSGSANVEGSSTGQAKAGATVKYKKGRWTYELQAQGNAGRTSRSSYHILRSAREIPAGPPTINTEDGNGSSYLTGSFLSAKATRAVDDRTSAYAQAFGGTFKTITKNAIEFGGLTPDFQSFDEVQRSTSSGRFDGLELGLDHKGRKDGETLKATAIVFSNPSNRNNLDGSLGDGDSFRIERREPNRVMDDQIDWAHPIGKSQILSAGLHWFQEKRALHYQFINRGADPSLGPDQSGQFDALVDTVSVYATYQWQIGSWAVMPGVRAERYWRTVSSPGLPTFRVTRTKLFPSFHLDHPLSKLLDFTLSYSKRIDRPAIDQLRPFPIVVKVNAIDGGNPALLAQSTDAYEVNLHYHRDKLDVGLVLYDRETDHLFSQSYSINAGGINVVTPINAGHKTDRGAEFDVTTPLLKRVKATASINLFDSRVPVDPAAGSAKVETFRYTGNATLEWDGLEHGKRPGDIGQLQLIYESPSRSYQIRNRGFLWTTLSYTHSFSRTLSITASINGLGAAESRHRLRAPLVQEDYVNRDRLLPEFKLKLAKTFGSGQ